MTFIRQYKWLMSLLAFTVAMLIVRMVYTRSLIFGFVPWNMVLAVVPLIFSHQLQKAQRWFTKLFLFGMWLLFFPNAMYVVTDLFHLRERPMVPQWYDLLILFSAALNGVILGMASLYQVEAFLRKSVSTGYVPVIIFLLFLLCGYGIYMGRYLRCNSWDIFTNPVMILWDIKQDLFHPFRYNQSWMVTILFATWLYILYRYFKKLTTTSQLSY